MDVRGWHKCRLYAGQMTVEPKVKIIVIGEVSYYDSLPQSNGSQEEHA